MLNNPDSIRRIWPGASVDIDDEVKNDDGKTAYDFFLEEKAKEVARRLKNWVGADAYLDAESENPTDTDRKESLLDAEMYLFNVCFIEKLFSDNASGLVKDTQIPSGMRTSFNILTEDGYEKAIEMWTSKAYRSVLDYII